jgi:hypothetical protein
MKGGWGRMARRVTELEKRIEEQERLADCLGMLWTGLVFFLLFVALFLLFKWLLG